MTKANPSRGGDAKLPVSVRQRGRHDGTDNDATESVHRRSGHVRDPVVRRMVLPSRRLAHLLLASRAPAAAELFRHRRRPSTAARSPAYSPGSAGSSSQSPSIAATSALRRFDRALTGDILGAAPSCAATCAWHSSSRVIGARLAAGSARNRPFEVGEEPNLGRDELRALELHAKLAPGFALAVSDMAQELGARVTRSARRSSGSRSSTAAIDGRRARRRDGLHADGRRARAAADPPRRPRMA